MSLLIRFLICISALGVCLYSYLDTQNEVTWRRLEIPLVEKQNKELRQSNTCLQYEIDLFESPEHLMELASRSEFAYLKQPLLKEILVLQEAPSLGEPSEILAAKTAVSPRLRLAIGAKQ
jgi:hypothetical protein